MLPLCHHILLMCCKMPVFDFGAMIQMDLNENQKDAVGWQDGAVMVLAGPGAGKTLVLTKRISRLIKESESDSFRILAMTFTRSAAKEMCKRLEGELGDISRVKAQTFHSFAMDVLVRFGSVIGLKPDFAISEDGADCRDILRKLLQSNDIGAINEEDAQKGIDVILRNGLTDQEVQSYIEVRPDISERFRALRNVFGLYKSALTSAGVIDYPMMLYLAKSILETQKGVLSKVRLVYKYYCVDEFQDTSEIQYRLLRLLAPPGANVFVVADDDQTIFQWNGASPSRVKDFIKEYSADIIQLPENYRCPDQVVRMSNSLISHNSARYSGKIQGYSRNKYGNVVDYSVWADWDDEMDGVCTSITNNVPVNNRNHCLVIARSNNLLQDMQRKMNTCGIKGEIVAQRKDFSSEQIAWVHHFLRFMTNPESRTELEKVCLLIEKIALVEFPVANIYDKCAIQGLSAEDVLFLSLHAIPGFKREAELCEKYRNVIKTDYERFSTEMINLLNPNYSDLECVDSEYEADRKIWQDALARHKSFGRLGLSNFLQELSMSPKMPPLSSDCVKLQTVHTAKGTESDFVYVVGLSEGVFPSFQSLRPLSNGNESPQLQEERRSLFVAITRTLKRLHLSRARQYKGYRKAPSRFLAEMGLESNV